MEKRAFVTGSTGFLGLNLVEALVSENWEVFAFHRDSSDLKFLSQFQVNHCLGDVLEPNSLLATMPEGVDAVFHVAGDTSFWSGHNQTQSRINVEGTRNVVEAARAKHAKRFLYTSSIGSFGHHTGRLSESTPSNAESSPVNYFRSKYLAEQIVKQAGQSGMSVTILNPSNIIGPYDTHNWGRMFLMVKNGSLPGIPPGAGTFCSAKAVARAHISAVEQGKNGENYILGGADASYLEALQVIGSLLDKSLPKRPTPAWLLRTVGIISDWTSKLTRKEPSLTPELATILTVKLYSTSEKAIRELGYQCPSLQEIFETCYDWLKKEALL